MEDMIDTMEPHEAPEQLALPLEFPEPTGYHVQFSLDGELMPDPEPYDIKDGRTLTAGTSVYADAQLYLAVVKAHMVRDGWLPAVADYVAPEDMHTFTMMKGQSVVHGSIAWVK